MLKFLSVVWSQVRNGYEERNGCGLYLFVVGCVSYAVEVKPGGTKLWMCGCVWRCRVRVAAVPSEEGKGGRVCELFGVYDWAGMIIIVWVCVI